MSNASISARVEREVDEVAAGRMNLSDLVRRFAPAIEALEGLPEDKRLEARALRHELELADEALEEGCAPNLGATLCRVRDYLASLEALQ